MELRELARRVARRFLGREPAVYVGAFLTPQSRRHLLREFPPAHPRVYADHVTIQWGGRPEDLAKFKMGSILHLRVVGYAEDSKAQAVVVVLPSDVARHANRNPHVTISTTPGVAPVYSNELIARGWKRVPQRTYTAVLDTFPRKHGVRTPFFPLASRVAESWLREKMRVV